MLDQWTARAHLRLAACVVWAATALPAAAQTAAAPGAVTTPPAIGLFFQRPVFSQAQLSPDGQWVAMLLADKDHPARLAVLNLATMKPEVVAAFTDVGVNHFRWVNDKRLVFDLETKLTGPARIEAAPGLFAVNIDGSGFKQLVESMRYWAQAPQSGTPMLSWDHYLHDALGSQTGDEVLVISAGERSKEKTDFLSLQRLNTVTGRAQDVDGPLHTVEWTLDDQNNPRVVVTNQAYRHTVMLRDAKGQWVKLHETDAFDGEGWHPRWIDPDGTLYVQAAYGDKAAIYTADLATGKLSAKPVFASKDFDLHPDLLVRNGKLIGARYTIDAEVTQWLDPKAQALQATIDALLPSTANRVSLPSRGDSPFVLVQAFADVLPMTTMVYNTSTKKLTKLGVSYPGIDSKQMGQTDFVRYKARDGREIPAYITLPPGGAKTNLPMVVLVHGGPFVRGMQWRWDPEVQFLASRGYAVLQPEFRGSTGYGHQHFKAGWKQWGQAMQTDVADGARWAIAQGIANPKRVAIAGASYGGYATLMGLAQEPGLFKAGINWVGVTDLNLMYDVSWSDFSNEWKQYGMPRMVGDQKADAAMLKANSPLENAARIKQPLLMAYGGWDVRVPIVHGEKFRDAVKPHNAQVEWVVYPEEGHGWRKLETSVDFWGRVERFLAEHLTER